MKKDRIDLEAADNQENEECERYNQKINMLKLIPTKSVNAFELENGGKVNYTKKKEGVRMEFIIPEKIIEFPPLIYKEGIKVEQPTRICWEPTIEEIKQLYATCKVLLEENSN
jgi:hypothetical protein